MSYTAITVSFGDSVDNSFEGNSNVFSAIQMCQLSSASTLAYSHSLLQQNPPV